MTFNPDFFKINYKNNVNIFDLYKIPQKIYVHCTQIQKYRKIIKLPFIVLVVIRFYIILI